MKIMWQDLRYGVRMLVKSPGFTFVAIIALALGISANTAIFSVVNAVLLRTLPYEHAERLVKVYGASPQEPESRAPLSYPDFLDYKTQAATFEYFATYQQIGTSLFIGDEPERVFGTEATADLFPLLGVEPEIGRVFTAEEDRPGGPSVIVISHGLWQRLFNSDPNIVGREVRRGSRTVTVIGVMSPDFKFPVEAEKVDFWTPLVAETALSDATTLTNRDSRFLPVVGKLKPGATLEAAAAEMDTLARGIEQRFPATHTGNRVRLLSLHTDVVGDIRPALLVLLGAVAFVLLIACANVANLLLARAGARGKEIAVRTALGASRWRIMRQLLTESLLLSLMGGALGLLLAWWGVDLLVAEMPADLPRASEISLDGRVLVFTLAVSLLTGIFFGLAPALQASKPDLNETLKEGGRGSTEGGRNRVRGLLVVSEVALSLVLLVGAGLLIKSFFQLLNANPGYDTARVLSVTLPLSKSKYPEPGQQIAFLQQVAERVKALPGVESVGATNQLPLGNRETRNTFNVEGRPPAAPGQRLAARNQVVTAGYFRAMNIPLRRGRAFAEQDAQNSTPVIIINEALAQRYFGAEDPLGQRILIEDENNNPLPPREIVGIVGNVRHNSLEEEEYSEYYVPFAQAPEPQLVVVARTAGDVDPAGIAPAVRAAIRELDRQQLIWEVRTMRERVARSIAPRRFTMLLLGCFAFVALLLAAIGIFGVMSYTVTQRTHEIGIRLALGAQTGDMLKMIVGQGMALALVGIGLGLIGAFVVTRLLASLLFGVSTTDPLVYAGVATLLTVIALLACYIPARRAMRVDPMVALRYE